MVQFAHLEYIQPPSLRLKLQIAVNGANGPHPAIAACCQAYLRRFQKALNHRASMQVAASRACQAYRAAMPSPVSLPGLSATVRSAAYGLLIGAVGRDILRLYSRGVKLAAACTPAPRGKVRPRPSCFTPVRHLFAKRPT